MRKHLRLSFLCAAIAAPGLAAAGTTPQTLPFAQDWSSDQITTNDDWTGVAGIEGYRGDNLTAATGADPQTLTAEDSPGVVDVNANQTNPATFLTGGVAEFAVGGDRVVALSGSGTADAPYIKIFLNTTGEANITVAYDVRDFEASADNAAQQVALQYRVGTTGAFTNLAGGYVSDATDVTVATKVTAISVELPDDAENQAHVELRIMTTNASGNDEWVGIDNIQVTGGAATPSDPQVSGAASPAALLPGDTTLLTAVVTGGLNPASTALAVTADLGAIGGSSGTTMFDDGSNGDVAPGDGTFSLSVAIPGAQAPGAVAIPVLVTDGEGRDGTDSIALSIIADVTIAQIQGFGVGSPLALNTQVQTEGVVTALRTNGYFIQSVTPDADPATAEGLFVFTNAAPAGIAVGDMVSVAGRVTEFSRTPHGFPLTQLSNSTPTVLSTGNALPAPVRIAKHLVPTLAIDYLGRFQGMRVEVATADVIGPTNAFGDFYVTRGTRRPAREPGIAALDAVPLPPGNAIPLFDRNPERLRVESLGLVGGTELNVDNGTHLENLNGIMYYDRGDFTLLLGDRTGMTQSGGATISAVPLPTPGSLRVGSFNIENLSGGASVDLGRLEKLSDVFCNYLRNPDIVGLVEIGNIETAQRVAEAINTNEFDTCPDSPQYEARMLATSGSQRLGFLIKTAPAPGGIEDRVEVLSIQEEFLGETLTNPIGNPDGVLFDRAPLHLVARVTGENGSAYDVDVLLNHTLSLLDTVDLTPNGTWGTDGHRSRAKRMQQAVHLSELVDDIQTATPDRPLVLIGDYNAFNFSDGYVDVMGIIGGTPAAVNTVLVHADSAVADPLTNLIGTKPALQRYSYVFEGNIQTLDHALVNSRVLSTTLASLHHARVNSDFAVDNAADTSVPVRTSDHDPLVIDMVVPTFLDADLVTTLRARALNRQVPDQAKFAGTVTNAGPMRALRPTVSVTLTAAPEQVVLLGAAGWVCTAPVVAPGGAQSTCTRNKPLEAGVTDSFIVNVQTISTGSIQASLTAYTLSVDTDPSNDSASASVAVTQP